MIMQDKRTVPDNLRTGDLVFFQGRGWVSNAIKLLQWNRWSHIGVVIVDPEYGEPMIYEATHAKTLRNVETGKRDSGVRLVSFKNSINSFPGAMAIRRLHGVPHYELDHDGAMLLRKRLKGAPFKKSFLELMRADTFFLPKNTKTDMSSVFCSELVASFYQSLGLLCNCRTANNYGPAEFVNKKMRLLKGQLGPLQVIRRYRKPLQ